MHKSRQSFLNKFYFKELPNTANTYHSYQKNRTNNSNLFKFTNTKASTIKKIDLSINKSLEKTHKNIKQKKSESGGTCQYTKMTKRITKSRQKQKLNKTCFFKQNKKKKTKIVQSKKASQKQTGIKQKRQYQNNSQYYRQKSFDIESIDSLKIYKKIIQIFDLQLEQVGLPYQIQSFLNKSLRQLRKQINASYKSAFNTITALGVFKQSCIQIIKKSSISQMNIFLSTPLPQNQRWSVRNHSSIQKNRQQRIAYFGGLSAKIGRVDKKQLDYEQNLMRIQRNLQRVLEKSSKQRGVYL